MRGDGERLRAALISSRHRRTSLGWICVLARMLGQSVPRLEPPGVLASGMPIASMMEADLSQRRAVVFVEAVLPCRYVFWLL